jgi:hypothetical protein
MNNDNGTVNIIAEFNFDTGEMIMHKKVIEIRVDETGALIMEESQTKRAKCPVCGKHGVRVVSVATERTASKFCYSGELNRITIEFYCDNCATEKGTLTCDADYLKVEMVKMKKVREWRFFFYHGKLHNWMEYYRTTNKDEYTAIMKGNKELNRIYNESCQPPRFKCEENHEWVNA